MIERWGAFFEVQVGASASLLGLVFVGLSINFARIIGSSYLPNRALEAMTLLLLNMALAMLFLVPGQALRLFGVEVFALSTVVWVSVSVLHLHNYRQVEAVHKRKSLVGTGLGQLAAISWWVSGAVLFFDGEAGLYWLVPSFLLSYLLALLNAWVLLVEINR